jgi:hypothetical protein
LEELRRKWQESNEVTRKIPEYEQKTFPSYEVKLKADDCSEIEDR